MNLSTTCTRSERSSRASSIPRMSSPADCTPRMLSSREMLLHTSPCAEAFDLNASRLRFTLRALVSRTRRDAKRRGSAKRPRPDQRPASTHDTGMTSVAPAGTTIDTFTTRVWRPPLKIFPAGINRSPAVGLCTCSCGTVGVASSVTMSSSPATLMFEPRPSGAKIGISVMPSCVMGAPGLRLVMSVSSAVVMGSAFRWLMMGCLGVPNRVRPVGPRSVGPPTEVRGIRTTPP